MAGLSTILGIAGSVVSAVGTIAAGQAARRDAEFQAAQYDIQAKDEFAAAQREAEEIRRNKQLVLSRQQAAAAGSGLGADDPTVVFAAEDVSAYGKEQELSALAAGQMRRNQAEMAAASKRAGGRADYAGSLFSAGGTIIGGFANAFARKYGNGGPPTTVNNYYGAMTPLFGRGYH